MNLLKIYILLTTVSCHCSALMVKQVNVSEANYCSKDAMCTLSSKPEPNTACGCHRIRTMNIEVHDIYKFRQEMRDEMNKVRNFVAQGKLKKKTTNEMYPKAADMRILNYNVELEYVAICYAGIIKVAHDECRTPVLGPHHEHNIAGQNVGYRTEPLSDPISLFDSFLNEKENYDAKKESLANFKGTESSQEKQSGHFTQLIWAADSEVGCARSFNTNLSAGQYIDKKYYAGTWFFICNFCCGGSNGPGPVYTPTEGEPCSQCPKGTKCNSKYKALCGDLDPIGITYPPPIIPVEGGENVTIWWYPLSGGLVNKAPSNSNRQFHITITLILILWFGLLN